MQKYDEEQGQRLKWVRTQLELKSSFVYEKCNIPRSTFFDKEKGTNNYYLSLILANFYNLKWNEKFIENYPAYNGKEVKMITMNFLVYGRDYLQDCYDKHIEFLTTNFKNKEKDYMKVITRLKSEGMKRGNKIKED